MSDQIVNFLNIENYFGLYLGGASLYAALTEAFPRGNVKTLIFWLFSILGLITLVYGLLIKYPYIIHGFVGYSIILGVIDRQSKKYGVATGKDKSTN